MRQPTVQRARYAALMLMAVVAAFAMVYNVAAYRWLSQLTDTHIGAQMQLMGSERPTDVMTAVHATAYKGHATTVLTTRRPVSDYELQFGSYWCACTHGQDGVQSHTSTHRYVHVLHHVGTCESICKHRVHATYDTTVHPHVELHTGDALVNYAAQMALHVLQQAVVIVDTQTDNVVWMKPTGVDSDTSSRKVVLQLQNDCNLVLLVDQSSVWSSATGMQLASSSECSMSLNSHGVDVMHNDQSLWRSTSTYLPAATGELMSLGGLQQLKRDEYSVRLASDRLLVQHGDDVVWETVCFVDTRLRPHSVVLQHDCNLIVHTADGGVCWQSGRRHRTSNGTCILDIVHGVMKINAEDQVVYEAIDITPYADMTDYTVSKPNQLANVQPVPVSRHRNDLFQYIDHTAAVEHSVLINGRLAMCSHKASYLPFTLAEQYAWQTLNLLNSQTESSPPQQTCLYMPVFQLGEFDRNNVFHRIELATSQQKPYEMVTTTQQAQCTIQVDNLILLHADFVPCNVWHRITRDVIWLEWLFNQQMITEDTASRSLILLEDGFNLCLPQLYLPFGIKFIRRRDIVNHAICADQVIVKRGSLHFTTADVPPANQTQIRYAWPVMPYISSLSQRFDTYYGAGSTAQPLDVLIINRVDGRQLHDGAKLTSQLQANGYAVEYLRLESLPFKDLVQQLAVTRLLVGVHGAGLSNMLWMPQDSSVLEVFPYLTVSELDTAPERTHYFNMAHASGHAHHDYVSPPSAECNEDNMPADARDRPVHVNVEQIAAQIRQILTK